MKSYPVKNMEYIYIYISAMKFSDSCYEPIRISFPNFSYKTLFHEPFRYRDFPWCFGSQAFPFWDGHIRLDMTLLDPKATCTSFPCRSSSGDRFGQVHLGVRKTLWFNHGHLDPTLSGANESLADEDVGSNEMQFQSNDEKCQVRPKGGTALKKT